MQAPKWQLIKVYGYGRMALAENNTDFGEGNVARTKKRERKSVWLNP